VLRFESGKLLVEVLPEAKNPIFFRGRQARRFWLQVGERFVIGQTTFTLLEPPQTVFHDAGAPLHQHVFSTGQLWETRFGYPDRRIEVLSRLPEVISRATDNEELCIALVSMLLAGIPRASSAAVIAREATPEIGAAPSGGPRTGQALRILYWDMRSLGRGVFSPSHRLVEEALSGRQSVLHVWQPPGMVRGGKGQTAVAEESWASEPAKRHAEISTGHPASQTGEIQSLTYYTSSPGVHWAFCAPVPGQPGDDWALYVAGHWEESDPLGKEATLVHLLREDLKFAEIVAATLASLRQLRRLARRQAALRQFLSPVVVQSLVAEDWERLLAPKETEVSVLFCDLRGFARHTEQSQGNLLGLLARVNQALGVMTRQILKEGGVIGDFQGDAAMGFWGWPVVQQDRAIRVCRAALSIRRHFESAAQDPGNPLAGFRVGIGIATGPAVAGKIGTEEQVKVTVFGPVVNLASRLEGMTKILRVPILLDETTAAEIRRQVLPEVARIRRLVRVRPYGMVSAIEVSELLLPEGEDPILTNKHVEIYERALEAFIAGSWREAYQWLHQLPPEDLGADLLTVFIAQHNRTAPPGWDGVIKLDVK